MIEFANQQEFFGARKSKHVFSCLCFNDQGESTSDFTCQNTTRINTMLNTFTKYKFASSGFNFSSYDIATQPKTQIKDTQHVLIAPSVSKEAISLVVFLLYFYKISQYLDGFLRYFSSILQL
jgi:hypothetical protein